MNWSVIIAILSTASVGFIVWYIQRAITIRTTKRLEKEKSDALKIGKAEEERRQLILDSLAEISSRLVVLEKKDIDDGQTLALLKQEIVPMSEFMKRKLVDILMHPSPEFHAPDRLLETLKEAGAHFPPELEPWLEERKTSGSPHVTEQEKLAAEALPIIVRLAELEAEEAEKTEITEIQLVSSTVKSTETKREEEDSKEQSTS